MLWLSSARLLAERKSSPTLRGRRSYKCTAFAGAPLFLTRISDVIRAPFQIVLCRIAAWLLIPSLAFVHLISICVQSYCSVPLLSLLLLICGLTCFYPIGTCLNSLSAVYPDLCCRTLVGFGVGDMAIPGSSVPLALGALHRFGWFWQPERQRPVTEDPQVNCSIPANLLGL